MGVRLKIDAVGDVSFAGSLEKNDSLACFANIEPVLRESDIVIANQECPLLVNGTAMPGKCTLKGGPVWAKKLAEAGIDIVSLANNHMMDYGEYGLYQTINSLKNQNIQHAGAGKNLQEAQQPVYIEKNGIKFGLLARTSVPVASRSNATMKSSGVAFFSFEELKETVKEIREVVDIIILIIHWGLEHYDYPSPSQRELASKLIKCGVDIILGHHPHVLQGAEIINRGMVVYSLGNFIFNDVPWCFIDKDGARQDRILKLTPKNRKAGIFRIEVADDLSLSYSLLPTVNPAGGTILLDDNQKRDKEFARLCIALRIPFYSFFWRLYSLEREWSLRIKPMIKGKLTWNKIKKIRLKHFKELFSKIVTSAKIISEKKSDPYSKKSL